MFFLSEKANIWSRNFILAPVLLLLLASCSQNEHKLDVELLLQDTESVHMPATTQYAMPSDIDTLTQPYHLGAVMFSDKSLPRRVACPKLVSGK